MVNYKDYTEVHGQKNTKRKTPRGVTLSWFSFVEILIRILIARDKRQEVTKLVHLGLGRKKMVTFWLNPCAINEVTIEFLTLCLRRMWGMGAQFWPLNKGATNFKISRVASELPFSNIAQRSVCGAS